MIHSMIHYFNSTYLHCIVEQLVFKFLDPQDLLVQVIKLLFAPQFHAPSDHSVAIIKMDAARTTNMEQPVAQRAEKLPIIQSDPLPSSSWI